jgi:hypothetical protein
METTSDSNMFGNALPLQRPVGFDMTKPDSGTMGYDAQTTLWYFLLITRENLPPVIGVR